MIIRFLDQLSDCEISSLSPNSSALRPTLLLSKRTDDLKEERINEEGDFDEEISVEDEISEGDSAAMRKDIESNAGEACEIDSNFKVSNYFNLLDKEMICLHFCVIFIVEVIIQSIFSFITIALILGVPGRESFPALCPSFQTITRPK